MAQLARRSPRLAQAGLTPEAQQEAWRKDFPLTFVVQHGQAELFEIILALASSLPPRAPIARR